MLGKQVGTGVSGDAELGKADDGCSLPCGLVDELSDVLDVVGAVGYACGRDGGGHFDKSVVHFFIDELTC